MIATRVERHCHQGLRKIVEEKELLLLIVPDPETLVRTASHDVGLSDANIRGDDFVAMARIREELENSILGFLEYIVVEG